MIFKKAVKGLIVICLGAVLFFSMAPLNHGTENLESPPSSMVLKQAAMCEAIDVFEVKNPAIVFPISIGKIFCFTSFEEVQNNEIIYHKWFQKDRLISNNRFYLKAPRWSTFSTMQLRMADRGPWRVEVTDKAGKILKTLRFSISD